MRRDQTKEDEDEERKTFPASECEAALKAARRKLRGDVGGFSAKNRVRKERSDEEAA